MAQIGDVINVLKPARFAGMFAAAKPVASPDPYSAIMAAQIENMRLAMEQAASIPRYSIPDNSVAMKTVESAVAVLPDPTEVIPSSEKEETERYSSLAQKLGVQCPEILERSLQHVLADECIRVYDYPKVCAYMDAMLIKERAPRQQPYLIWNWIALRKGDSPIAPVDALSGGAAFRPGFFPWSEPSTAGPYDKPIPYPVLETIAKVVDRMGPENVEFYVTDYQVKDPDPFLAVRAKGTKTLYVIERWDEPSFRG